MDNKPKEDKLMVITLDNSNPKSKIYWKEEDYNIFIIQEQNKISVSFNKQRAYSLERRYKICRYY